MSCSRPSPDYQGDKFVKLFNGLFRICVMSWDLRILRIYPFQSIKSRNPKY